MLSTSVTMCLTLITNNASQNDGGSTVVDSLDISRNGEDDSYLGGKRRKMSKTDSPNPSSSPSSPSTTKHCFDVATLMDAIHREVIFDAYAESMRSFSQLQQESKEDEEEARVSEDSDEDDFTFIDISETPPEEEDNLNFGFPTLFSPPRPLSPRSSSNNNDEEDQPKRRGSGSALLGKRSRGLTRSQTVSSNLCLMG